MRYKTFDLSDLFSVERGTRLTVDRRINGKRPLITAGFENTGVAGYINNPEQKIFPANVLTIDMFGNVFYRDYEFSADDNILVLTFQNTLNRGRALFLTATISASIRGKFSYGKQYRQGSFNTTSINLPVDENGKINFLYMENHIQGLEAERIQGLEAYLKVTDLSDYTLTPAEQAVLVEFHERESKRFAQFRIIDLFTVKNTRSILSRDITEKNGATPYLTASQSNNAVGAYINYDDAFLDKGNCIFIGGKTFVVTYQEQDFFSNDSHNLALYLKDESKKTKETQLFMVATIYKSLSHLYSWGDSISSKKIQKDHIELPVTDNGDIDYKFMTLFVQAQQKLTIKNVVVWQEKYMPAALQVAAA